MADRTQSQHSSQDDAAALDKAQSLDPVLTQRTQAPSPAEEKQIVAERDKDVLKRLAQADASGPTIRQRTQSEIIDLTLLQSQLGNPFSVRWIPFEQMREMTTDLMLAFGWWMTLTQLARAEYSFQSSDAQLSAAVDAAYRPIAVETLTGFTNDLWFGHQPAVKRFRLGRLDASYRDPNGKDPDKDLPVWTSSADALLWKSPAFLNPSHCLPQWDEDGQMVGYKFSQTPIPHNDLISAASAYGYMVIPGHFIGPDFALWTVNEQQLQFGSIFGRPRTQRAYPYWWCNPPEAPILMADYTLKPLGMIEEGDEIIGWERKTNGNPRPGVEGTAAPRDRLCKSTVLAVSRRRSDMVKVTFESGHVIRCTPDHLWHLFPGPNNTNRASKGTEWGSAEVGREISRVLDLNVDNPAKPFLGEQLTIEQMLAAQWLGGIYDGEGSGREIGQHCDCNPDVCARIEASLDLLGFEYSYNVDRYFIKGGRQEIMRFARLTRPTRTRAMDRVLIDDKGYRFRRGDKVVSVEPDGEDWALGMTTTTGNYVAWGLASKNSYWFRWRLADRSYENLADPAKLVYYPIDFQAYIDPEDPSAENPTVRQARQTAIDIGNQTRSGATIAMPGSLAETNDGTKTNMRKWDIQYLEARNNFSELDATFRALDVMKLRAWAIPEQALIEGSGSRTAGGSGGGTGGARMATQLGQIYEESNQVLVERYDQVINEHFIPQFIAANFPEKVGTPCRKVSRALGVLDDQTRSQLLTLIGQVRGEVLPVNIRALLEQMNVPLLNEAQMKAEIKQISALAALMGPPEQAPEKVGTQGYNAGVMKSDKGGPNLYVQPPQRIVLAESDGFMNSLPDTPHYRDAAVRSAIVRLRRLLLDRYKEQYGSFVEFLKQQPTLHLAQDGQQKSGLDEKRAATTAASIIALWASKNAPGAPGHASQVVGEGVGERFADLSGLIALRGGKTALKSARLEAEDFGKDSLQPWVQERVKFALDSIEQTVRTEAQEWLASELQESVDPATVSSAAEEWCADFPMNHANRAARTEGSVNFNRGVLEALHSAGVAQVQAHDASDGTDLTTDEGCQSRNGAVYSVEDAMNLPTHPNDTLYFSPLTTESLSVERVEKLPSHLAAEDQKVIYDPSSETLYLSDEFDEDQERALLLMLGDQLSMT